MTAPEVRQPTDELMDQLADALALDAYGASVRVTFGKSMALREGQLHSVVTARVECWESAPARGKAKFVPVGLPLVPPDGEGLPDLLELLALIARGVPGVQTDVAR